MSTYLFIDTEFTQLDIHEKKLISVGVYGFSSAGDPHSFYVELADSYALEDCSSFVKLYVLCHLEHKHIMRYEQLIIALGAFIENIEDDVILISDAPSWDFSFFTDFLNVPTLRPSNLKHLGWTREYMQVPEADAMREHHALDDAIVNAIMVRQLEKEGYEAIKILKTF